MAEVCCGRSVYYDYQHQIQTSSFENIWFEDLSFKDALFEDILFEQVAVKDADILKSVAIFYEAPTANWFDSRYCSVTICLQQ